MTDYKVAQKVIHWLMAFFIITDLIIASRFGHPMEIADRLESREYHSDIGIILLLLLVIRVMLRRLYGTPPLPLGMASWQVKAAQLVHGLIYVTLFGLIGTGLVTALNATDPIMLFQSINLSGGNLDEEQFQFVRQFHDFFTEMMIALIIVHFGGALFHSFVQKDDSTRKMLRFWTSSDTTNDA